MNNKSDVVDMPCIHCGAGAVAIYYFDKGCFCNRSRLQALCAQHVVKATPLGGMRFICLPPGVEPNWGLGNVMLGGINHDNKNLTFPTGKVYYSLGDGISGGEDGIGCIEGNKTTRRPSAPREWTPPIIEEL